MDIRKNKITIALDGHSSCGKSTFAKAIAEKYNYVYIDTGAMYRAITLASIRDNAIEGEVLNLHKMKALLAEVDIRFRNDEETGRRITLLNNEDVEEEIRRIEVSNLVSIVSKESIVREKMVALQQEMGKEKGIVMDGRDIGTVVFPEAELKLFMTADVEIRAKRRYLELQEKGESTDFMEILSNIEMRDRIDESREIAPLRKADDAIVLDNSAMSPEEQMKWLENIIENL